MWRRCGDAAPAALFLSLCHVMPWRERQCADRVDATAAANLRELALEQGLHDGPLGSSRGAGFAGLPELAIDRAALEQFAVRTSVARTLPSSMTRI